MACLLKLGQQCKNKEKMSGPLLKANPSFNNAAQIPHPPAYRRMTLPLLEHPSSGTIQRPPRHSNCALIGDAHIHRRVGLNSRICFYALFLKSISATVNRRNNVNPALSTYCRLGSCTSFQKVWLFTSLRQCQDDR